MISVKQADRIIKNSLKKFSYEKVNLSNACNRVLQEDLKADRDLPAFDKSLMDGVAINTASLKKGAQDFVVQGIQAAGEDPIRLSSPKGCAEIMTGAPLPKGADCVIAIEKINFHNGKVSFSQQRQVQPYLNVRRQGSDYKRGEVLLKKGHLLNPSRIAIAAAIGKSKLKVSLKPKVAIISTGDEIVDINVKIKPYQSRKSNSYFLQAALEQTGLFQTTAFHFKDNKKLLLDKLKRILADYGVIVLTGGVSMGKFDFVPQVLQELGVKVLFHKVKQKPGKPFWFGLTKDHRPVFALPGNPVSTQVMAIRYVLPSLKRALGVAEMNEEFAVMTKDFNTKTDFTFFLPVIITNNKKGVNLAKAVITGGSGDFASLGRSDGFVELPAKNRKIQSGYVAKLYRWKT